MKGGRQDGGAIENMTDEEWLQKLGMIRLEESLSQETQCSPSNTWRVVIQNRSFSVLL